MLNEGFAVQRTAVLIGWVHASGKSKCSNNLFKSILEGLFLKLLLLIQSYFFFLILQRVPGENPRAKRSEMDSFTKH